MALKVSNELEFSVESNLSEKDVVLYQKKTESFGKYNRTIWISNMRNSVENKNIVFNERNYNNFSLMMK